ncbi:hypothetical protein HNP46_004693 [Pseudomonas nitritireducens]|uniref:Serine protease n=1 Tax=Pseudomonas nitroreducens TaxID=46680 RepID=A0A7W7P401_PSENT|nr:S1C family serine protease [Pseudomonas nitritireducens]MBB4865792.1 hypothetical protein [Pseudomonas nitritireducens]
MSALKLWPLFVASLLALPACSTAVRPVPAEEATPGYFPVSSAGALPSLYFGSAVQWNEHYAVSAAHIPSLANVAHRCSTGCDLVFIRREAQGALPLWRPAVTGESLEAVGQSPFFETVKGVGTSKAQRVRLNGRNDRTAYALADAPVVEGMSGGPIYGRDDAVVGITVGTYTSTLPSPMKSADNEPLTVYVPYDVVLREWQLFARTLASKGQLPGRIASDG